MEEITEGDNKRTKYISKSDLMEEFIYEIIKHGGMVFGGAVRDMISGEEPVDIDVYFYGNPKHANWKLPKYTFSKMEKWTFKQLPQETNWTKYTEEEEKEYNGDEEYKTKDDNFKAIVIPYLVNDMFKVDFVISRHSLCFSNLDCVVNGLVLTKFGISYVSNFNYEPLKKFSDDERTEIARKMIAERKAGIIPGCAPHRLEKMKNKGYDISYGISYDVDYKK